MSDELFADLVKYVVTVIAIVAIAINAPFFLLALAIGIFVGIVAMIVLNT